MCNLRKGWTALAVVLLLCGSALAQSGQGPNPTSGSDRFFLSFAEDATVIDGQWWEGQFEFSDGDRVDTSLLRGVVAIQPWRDVEVGARVGFGNSDTPAPLPDGSGATDLDAWGKYHLGRHRDDWEFAVGGILNVPTGDDTAGLGTDAFGLTGFGSLRYRLPEAIVGAHIGLRVSEDGQVLGSRINSKSSLAVGFGALFPFSDRLTIVAETRYEGNRFKGFDDDWRVLGGANWRATGRGMLRGAVSIGLTDGAPDAQFLVGYAARF